MMVQSSSFISDFDIRNLSPLFDDSVVIFIVTDGNWIMYDISNSIDKFVDEFELLFFLFFYNLLLFLVGIFLLDFLLTGILLICFLFVFDHITNIIPLFVEWV